MAAKAIMVNLGQHRTASVTLCEEQLEKAPDMVFRMESGSCDPNDTPQEKRQRRIPSKMDAENSQKLSENKRMVCNLAHTHPFSSRTLSIAATARAESIIPARLSTTEGNAHEEPPRKTGRAAQNPSKSLSILHEEV
jgi:hypothetical protein